MDLPDSGDCGSRVFDFKNRMETLMKMKRKIMVLILFFSFSGFYLKPAHAALPTFDSVNAALNQLRNALMQSQFIEEMRLAMERLEQLKATYLELLRFHAGLDDLVEVFVGDPIKAIKQKGETLFRDVFQDLASVKPQILSLREAGSPGDIRAHLEEITGRIPDSDARPYIPFEEMQVIEGFELAGEIRREGEKTREAAESIAQQALLASPKGAARLQAQAMGQMILVAQQNQEALAKLIELEATQVEQVSREEKRLERERIKYMDDANTYLDGVIEAPQGGGGILG